jgi:hypothetical protein
MVSDGGLESIRGHFQGKQHTLDSFLGVLLAPWPIVAPDYKKTEISNLNPTLRTIAQGTIPIVIGLP